MNKKENAMVRKYTEILKLEQQIATSLTSRPLITNTSAKESARLTSLCSCVSVMSLKKMLNSAGPRSLP